MEHVEKGKEDVRAIAGMGVVDNNEMDFLVRAMPPSMEEYVLEWGKLQNEQESDFIEALLFGLDLVQNTPGQTNIVVKDLAIHLVTACLYHLDETTPVTRLITILRWWLGMESDIGTDQELYQQSRLYALYHLLHAVRNNLLKTAVARGPPDQGPPPLLRPGCPRPTKDLHGTGRGTCSPLRGTCRAFNDLATELKVTAVSSGDYPTTPMYAADFFTTVVDGETVVLVVPLLREKIASQLKCKEGMKDSVARNYKKLVEP